ncbi:MAG: cytochrome P450 [Sedimenticolaceae bacterium]
MASGYVPPFQVPPGHPFAYFPFSLGPHGCIGSQLSLYEARLVLGMLLRRLEAHVVGGGEIGAVLKKLAARRRARDAAETAPGGHV